MKENRMKPLTSVLIAAVSVAALVPAPALAWDMTHVPEPSYVPDPAGIRVSDPTDASSYGVPAYGKTKKEKDRYCQNRNYKVGDFRASSYGGRCMTGREIATLNGAIGKRNSDQRAREHEARMAYERTPEGQAAHQRFQSRYDWSTLPVRCFYHRNVTGYGYTSMCH